MTRQHIYMPCMALKGFRVAKYLTNKRMTLMSFRSAAALCLGVFITCLLMHARNCQLSQGKLKHGTDRDQATKFAQPPNHILRIRGLVKSDHASLRSNGKKRLWAVVGVQTGFVLNHLGSASLYQERRKTLRKTWFPSLPEDADRLEQETGILYRFVIGHSKDPEQEAVVNEEMDFHGNCIRLSLQEDYTSLAKKTVMFIEHVNNKYDAQYIVKVDDDVYLRKDRLQIALAQWKDRTADYVGCMSTGAVHDVPYSPWYEPQYTLFGESTYFTHASGPIYAISGKAASILQTALDQKGLRYFSNEDVTVGSWMMAFNVSHLDDRRLCEGECGAATVGIHGHGSASCPEPCNLTNWFLQLHNKAACNTPVFDENGGVPLLIPYFSFRKLLTYF